MRVLNANAMRILVTRTSGMDRNTTLSWLGILPTTRESLDWNKIEKPVVLGNLGMKAYK